MFSVHVDTLYKDLSFNYIMSFDHVQSHPSLSSPHYLSGSLSSPQTVFLPSPHVYMYVYVYELYVSMYNLGSTHERKQIICLSESGFFCLIFSSPIAFTFLQVPQFLPFFFMPEQNSIVNIMGHILKVRSSSTDARLVQQ